MHTWLALLLLLASSTPTALADMTKEPAAKEPDAVPVAPVRGRFTLVHVERVEASGAFDHNIVTRIVRTRSSALLACYERELRQSPAPFEGRVVIGLTITPSGSIANVHVESNDTGNASTAACAQRVIQGFRFNPGPDADAVFSIAMQFRPA